MRLTDEQVLYVRAMGKAVRVTAMFLGREATNTYLEKHPDEGVVAQFGRHILVANIHDQGAHIREGKTLTPEQVAALKYFRELHGRRWKTVLRKCWERGGPYGVMHPDYAPLRQLRNDFGPSWLATFRLED